MLAVRALVPRRVVFAALFSLPLLALAPRAIAAPPAGTTLNACGCYRDDVGICYCEKKSKCGCEGECEPKGCEEKRAKEREKELENEVKLAKQRDTSHREAQPGDKAGDKSTAVGGRGKARIEEKTAEVQESRASEEDSGEGGSCPPCPCAAGKASKKKAKSAK